MYDKTCKVCGRPIPDGHVCLSCGDYDDMQTFNQQKPKTNGDRIRAMTDKELAKWLCSMERRALLTNSMTRPAGWQKWLESEVQGE